MPCFSPITSIWGKYYLFQFSPWKTEGQRVATVSLVLFTPHICYVMFRHPGHTLSCRGCEAQSRVFTGELEKTAVRRPDINCCCCFVHFMIAVLSKLLEWGDGWIMRSWRSSFVWQSLFKTLGKSKTNAFIWVESSFGEHLPKGVLHQGVLRASIVWMEAGSQNVDSESCLVWMASLVFLFRSECSCNIQGPLVMGQSS